MKTLETISKYAVTGIAAIALAYTGCRHHHNHKKVKTPVEPPVNYPLFVRGDVDGNGKINLTDAIRLTYFLNNVRGQPEVSCLKTADVNDDGCINPSDTTHILSYLFQSGPEPLAPFPEKGKDSTEDALTCNEYTGL